MTSHFEPEYSAIEPEASPFDHVMIDIETMSLHKHKALILSIGMIEFDPSDINKLHLGEQCLIVPTITKQLLLQRHVTVSTQKFWADQPTEASVHWQLPIDGHVSLADTVKRVRAFCKDIPNVWARGIQFDLSNLEDLAEDIGDTEELWHYQAPCDLRGFLRHTPATRIIPAGDALDIPGVPHDPIYDCISQAQQVWSHWQ